MTALPVNEDSLTNDQHEQMTDQFTRLLEQSGAQMIYPDTPRGTWVAVNTLEELIYLSVYLGSHNMLFDGMAGHYDFWEAGNCGDTDRLELYIFNYMPIPDSIKEYRLVFATGGIDDKTQAYFACEYIRSYADRWESSIGSITGFFADYDRLCQLCFVLMGTIDRVDLSGFTIHVPQV